MTANVAANILSISVDNNDAVVVTESGGNVLINGVDPLSGVHLAAPILKIEVTTTGNFANTIDLTSITQAAFSSLLMVTLDGGDGSDTYLLDQSGLLALANVSIADTGATGSDALTLSTTAAGPETIGINSGLVLRSTGATANYGGIETLQVDGSAAGDTISVFATAAGVATTVNGGGGVDVFAAIDLTTIAAVGLTINAGSNGESLTLNTTTAGTVAVSSTSVQRTGNGAVNYTGFATLDVIGTAAADTFNVASTDSGTATTINAMGGVDLFGDVDLTTIGAAGLSLNSGPDGELLVLKVTTAGTVNISATSVQRAGNGAVNHLGFATLQIDGTASADTFNVVSTANLTSTTINAAGGLDSFAGIDLTTIGIAGLTINAGGDGEALTLNTTTTGTVNLSSTTVQRTGNGPVNYSDLATLLVNGTTGADTFNVASIAAGTATTIAAAGGLDIFGAIDLTTIGATGLTIDAGGDGESLTLSTMTTGTVTVSSTTVQRSGNGGITYSGLAALSVNGTIGVDTFNVISTAASTATTINGVGIVDIFGNIDLTTIGAAGLTINAGGGLTANVATTGTVSISATSLQRIGNGSLNYSGLGLITINGTSGADTFNVISTSVSTSISVFAGAGLDILGAIDLTSINAGIKIDAGGNGETMILNVTSAGTVSISGLSVHRTGNGAVGYFNLANLQINGTAAGDTFNVASTAAGIATSILAAGGTDVFGPIALTTIGAAGLMIDAGGNGEVLTLNTTTTGTVDVSATTVQRTGNGPVNYTGFATLLVNGTAGADTFDVASTAAGTATTIDAAGGLDVFSPIDLTTIGAAGLTINAGGDGESLTLNVTITGTTDVSSTTVQRTGNGPVTYSGLAMLDINGTAGADAFNVASTHAATATTINALGGLDIFADIDLTTIGTAGLTINAGGDGESLTLNAATTGTVDISSAAVQRSGNGPVNYNGLATLTVNGTAGADTFNIASTSAATATTINADGGLDVFGAIALTTIGAAGLTVNAGGQGESLTLNTTTTGTVNVSSSTVQRVGNGPVDYTGLSTLIINGTGGADTFDVASTAAAATTTINAAGGTDIFDDIALTTIGAAGLTINAGGNGESLTLNTTSAGTVNISDALVQRTGNGAVNYTGLANLNVNSTSGVDVFNVLSTNAATAYTLNSGASNDLITLGDAGSLSGILGAMTLHGNSHDASPTNTFTAGPTSNILPVGDTLHFNDIAYGVAANYVFTATTFTRTGTALITFDTIESFVLDAGTMADTIDVQNTAASVNLTVNGNGSADIITLLANGASSNVLLYGGPSGDTINVRTIAAGSVVKAKGGTGDDTVNVSSDAPTNLGTLDGISGALLVDTDSGNDKLFVSDHGQNGLHNSNVQVTNNRIRGFAGSSNNTDIHYVIDGALELTLVGSNSRSDKFMVQLPSKTGLTMRFDGGGGTKDCVRIDGTSGNDTVRVGSFSSTRAFRLQKIECLQMFGYGGGDTLDNHAPVSSLIDGGDGNDTLLGWSKVDVIFGGDGVDTLVGNDGGDYLFGDHEFNNRHPRVKHSEDNDNMMGGTGIDTIVAVKTDIVSAGGNVGDTIIGNSKGITAVDWLRARFLTSASKNVQKAIDDALAQPCTM